MPGLRRATRCRSTCSDRTRWRRRQFDVIGVARCPDRAAGHVVVAGLTARPPAPVLPARLPVSALGRRSPCASPDTRSRDPLGARSSLALRPLPGLPARLHAQPGVRSVPARSRAAPSNPLVFLYLRFFAYSSRIAGRLAQRQAIYLQEP